MLCALVHPGLDQGHPSHLPSTNGANRLLEGEKRGLAACSNQMHTSVLKVTMLQWMLHFPERFLLLPNAESMYV